MEEKCEFLFKAYERTEEGKWTRDTFYRFLYELGRHEQLENQFEACFEFMTGSKDVTHISQSDFTKMLPKLYAVKMIPESVSGNSRIKPEESPHYSIYEAILARELADQEPLERPSSAMDSIDRSEELATSASGMKKSQTDLRKSQDLLSNGGAKKPSAPAAVDSKPAEVPVAAVQPVEAVPIPPARKNIKPVEVTEKQPDSPAVTESKVETHHEKVEEKKTETAPHDAPEEKKAEHEEKKAELEEKKAELEEKKEGHVTEEIAEGDEDDITGNAKSAPKTAAPSAAGPKVAGPAVSAIKSAAPLTRAVSTRRPVSATGGVSRAVSTRRPVAAVPAVTRPAGASTPASPTSPLPGADNKDWMKKVQEQQEKAKESQDKEDEEKPQWIQQLKK